MYYQKTTAQLTAALIYSLSEDDDPDSVLSLPVKRVPVAQNYTF